MCSLPSKPMKSTKPMGGGSPLGWLWSCLRLQATGRACACRIPCLSRNTRKDGACGADRSHRCILMFCYRNTCRLVGREIWSSLRYRANLLVRVYALHLFYFARAFHWLSRRCCASRPSIRTQPIDAAPRVFTSGGDGATAATRATPCERVKPESQRPERQFEQQLE